MTKRNVILTLSGATVLLGVFVFNKKKRGGRKEMKQKRNTLDIDEAMKGLGKIAEAAKSYKAEEEENIAKREFMDVVRGMSEEELQMVVDYAPMEMCVKKITDEIARVREFEKSIKAAAKVFN